MFNYALDIVEHSAKRFYNQRNQIIYLLLFCRALFILTFDMEATQFDYSTKNIPIPSERDYSKKLIEKTEQLCRRMRWKAHFYLNPKTENMNKETYGFNSKQTPPQIPELVSFEDRMLKMIQNIKFKDIKCNFQKKLSTDVTMINKSKTLIVPADKTTNLLFNYALDIHWALCQTFL